jgi:uncharacterized protein (TIGR03083 family)
MDQASLLASLASEGASLADAADGHLERPVPSCPEWDVAQLLTHAGGVYGWAGQVVAARGDRVGPRQPPNAPEEAAALLEWYRQQLAQLVEVLSVDPETPAWTFFPSAPDNAGWWLRRQALETAVHRWDAQAAAGLAPAPISPELAAEGIDETVAYFVPRALASQPVAELTGTLHLHATDTPGEWWLDFRTDELVTRREHAKADTALRGPASGLYLWLWNRQTPDAAGLDVFGRSETVTAWRAIKL